MSSQIIGAEFTFFKELKALRNFSHYTSSKIKLNIIQVSCIYLQNSDIIHRILLIFLCFQSFKKI